MTADFFVSYTQADRAWAEWIAWILEAERYDVLIQAWDFVPGSNWIQSMQDGATSAARTIPVLSEAYLGSDYGTAEWLAAWAADPAGRGRKLLPVRVQDCARPGFLSGIVSVDLFGKDEPQAKATLLKAVTAAIAGGDESLAALARDLSTGSTVTVHSVQGLGGVGKTQLAIEFAYTHASDYELVWSIAAEAATIPDQFAALARKLGLSPATDPSIPNLAMIQNDLGEFSTARKLAERVLVIDQAVYGPDHPDVTKTCTPRCDAVRPG